MVTSRYKYTLHVFVDIKTSVRFPGIFAIELALSIILSPMSVCISEKMHVNYTTKSSVNAVSQ